MAVDPSILGEAFTAFVVWLGVRIINRRERWAIWTAVALMAYPLLLGPACWMSSHTGRGAEIVSVIYEPLIFDGPEFAGCGLQWYSQLAAAKGWHWRLVSGGWTNFSLGGR
jgi:hypothetical protein